MIARDDVLRFQKRARYVANKRGFPQLADDFAQEVILTFLQNPDRRSTVDQLFIDYLRGTYGDTRSESGAARSKAQRNLHSLDAARDAAVDTEPQFENGECGFLFGGREAELYEAYFVEERTESNIAEAYGLTKSRISQLLGPVKKQLKEYFELRFMLERLEDDPVFTKVAIDWIRL